MEKAARYPETHTFTLPDGYVLHYDHFPACSTVKGQKRAILLFHRGHEHAQRMTHLVQELNLPDYDFFAWDARGHGRNAGARGYSPSFGTTVKDLDLWVQHLGAHHAIPVSECYCIGQSVGAVLLALWVHDYAPPIRGMTLGSPALDIKLYVPLAKPSLALMHKLRGVFYVNSYVQPQWLTHDPERIASYRQDPLITRPIAVNVLLGLYRAAKRLVADAQAINIPTQLFISGADFVVRTQPQHEFYAKLASPLKMKQVIDGFYHDTLGEAQRGQLLPAIRDFIASCFEQTLVPQVPQTQVRNAHQYSHSADVARELGNALPTYSWRNLYWQLTRLGLHVGASLSDGLALGQRTGFDSGSTLDYVYRNQAQGKTWLGRLIDRQYLNAPGWVGIRQRKVHLEQLLQWAIAQTVAQGRPVHILDIAAGHGRYILEGVLPLIAQVDSVLLRDYSELNVRDGQALISKLGLEAKAKFLLANAFVAESIATTTPAPSIAVVSGLYELFSDNHLIAESLSGLSQAVPKDGYLIYTNQPYHPQLEFIARALTSHRQGQAWVMRPRPQAEMDALVAEAGFVKINQLIDEEGIFSVAIAQKR